MPAAKSRGQGREYPGLNSAGLGHDNASRNRNAITAASMSSPLSVVLSSSDSPTDFAMKPQKGSLVAREEEEDATPADNRPTNGRHLHRRNSNSSTTSTASSNSNSAASIEPKSKSKLSSIANTTNGSGIRSRSSAPASPFQPHLNYSPHTNLQPHSYNEQPPASTLLVDQPSSAKWKNWWVRTFWTIIMISGFISILMAGHVWVTALVFAIQIIVYREVISIGILPSKERHLPWFRSLHWVLHDLPNGEFPNTCEFRPYLSHQSGFCASEFPIPPALTALIRWITLPSSVLFPSLFSSPPVIRSVLIMPLQFHALLLAAFASLIAPFGGFFASGVKRAFKIKDFGDSIPGHGGLTDRMDCQFIMGVFSSIYFQSFIGTKGITVGMLLQSAVSYLSITEQLELHARLGQYLAGQGVEV
ncbi:hypothetical protein BSLG_006859 [Batrachochytrium salamandrivorans]|nr:hypothetical protein BSLG_006859 [Batrachochytrium salamandrivorans]